MAQLAVVAVMAVSSIYKGMKTQEAAYEQADFVRDARNRSMAGTTARIGELERDKELMYSRALAASAASGAGIDDPGLVKLFGDLNAEGEYRVMAELYTGSSEAEGLRVQSRNLMSEGDAAHKAGWINAATTVLTSYAGGTLSSVPWTNTSNAGQWKAKIEAINAAEAAKASAVKKSSASALKPSYIGIT
jgi:hypothetical protein